MGLLLVATACLPDPTRQKADQVYDRLVDDRLALRQAPADPGRICDDVGEQESLLKGAPALNERRDSWVPLLRATDALLASCGQLVLAAQPGVDTPGLRDARARWALGAERELGQACDELRAAAIALGRPSSPTGC